MGVVHWGRHGVASEEPPEEGTSILDGDVEGEGASIMLSWEHMRRGGRFGFHLLLRLYSGGPQALLQEHCLLWSPGWWRQRRHGEN